MVMIYSAVHAVYLPTFQYDSATNWTMRSKVSFEDKAIAFDPTEDRGVAKPQYPFLYHSLQITANLLNPSSGNILISSWSDRNANVILWLLTIATFATMFLLLREHTDSKRAIIILGLIFSTPLFAVHTAQGYGDLNLAQCVLLSMAFVAAAHEEKRAERRHALWILSMLMAVAGAWTKSEGLFVTLLPWLGVFLWYQRRKSIQTILVRAFPVLLLSLPWYLFAITRGLRLSPHATDDVFSWHSEGLTLAMQGLFEHGSFGIAWYVILLFLLCATLSWWNKRNEMQAPMSMNLSLVLWGVYTTAFFLFVYLCTPNVEFLMNGQAFYRQLMIPCVQLILACGILSTSVASEQAEC